MSMEADKLILEELGLIRKAVGDMRNELREEFKRLHMRIAALEQEVGRTQAKLNEVVLMMNAGSAEEDRRSGYLH